MADEQLTRRDFHKLSLAALGGAVSGAVLAGCSQDPGGGDAATDGGDPHAGHDHAAGHDHDHAPADVAETAQASPFLSEPNVCRGLNVCKGHGQGGGNDCAGMSACHTAAKHGCHGHNECKGQGGCGETAGMNDCKGTGKCGVPLKESTWTKARARFETALKAASKSYGEPPA